MRIRFPLIAVVLCAAITSHAAGKPIPLPADVTPQALIQKTYCVADLVVPIPGCGDAAPQCPATTAKKCCDETCPACPGCLALGIFDDCPGCQPPVLKAQTREDVLIKLVTSTVSPRMWSNMGGPCTIEYFPIGMALVVSAPADVHAQIEQVFDSLRRLQDLQVTVEVRVVMVSADFFQRVGIDFNVSPKCGAGRASCNRADCPEPTAVRLVAAESADAPQEPRPTVALNDLQVAKFLESLQGDARSNVMCAPKITMFNRQASTIQCTDELHFVTGLKIDSSSGQTIFVPENKAYQTGLKVSLKPTVSADRKFVRVELEATHSELANANVPLFPVTTFIAPKLPDGSTGQPVPFTQFIQQPKFNKLCIEGKLCIPDGGTMLVDGGTIEHERHCEHSVPILSKTPYLSRLFKKTGTMKELDHIMVMVTPRVLTAPEVCEAKSQPMPCCADCAQCDAGRPCCVCCASACCQSLKSAGKCCDACPTCKAGKTCCDCCQKNCCKGGAASAEASPVPTRHGAEVAKKSPQELRNEKQAAKLVEKYHKAVADGDLEKARKYARQALDLDPACFEKLINAELQIDPNLRMKQLINDSFESGPPRQGRGIMVFPSRPIPERARGGIQ
jgi:hypothetical protein